MKRSPPALRAEDLDRRERDLINREAALAIREDACRAAEERWAALSVKVKALRREWAASDMATAKSH